MTRGKVLHIGIQLKGPSPQRGVGTSIWKQIQDHFHTTRCEDILPQEVFGKTHPTLRKDRLPVAMVHRCGAATGRWDLWEGEIGAGT